jgi:DNA-binding NarL/FixJ family response regulator
MIKNLKSDSDQQLTVLLVLHNRLLAEGLRLLLATGFPSYTVLFDTCDKEATSQPAADIIIIDPVSLANYNLASGQNSKLMLLDTGLSQDQLITLLLTHKIDGIIGPDTDLLLFGRAMHKVLYDGQVWMDNAILKALLQHAETLKRQEPNGALSRKEYHVVQFVSQGLKNREIADRLCISEQTVKSHLSRIFRKTNVTSRAQLVPLAIKAKLGDLY